MANLRYVSNNPLRVRVARQRRLLLFIGLPGTLGAFVLHPLLGFFSVVLLASLWNQGERPLHGACGEERALGHPVVHPGSLAELPEHYIVFNNLEVPTEGGGKRELDLVVLGRNGLFVVEVKHLRGEISGSDTDHHWQQIKRSQGGNLYTSAARNPVSQVRSAAGVLHYYLASRGIDIRVEGIAVFTHPAVVLKVKAERVPVVKLPNLARTILSHATSRPPRQFNETVAALKALRSGVADEPELEPGFKHVSVFMRDYVTSRERLAGLTAAQCLRLREALHKRPSPPFSQLPSIVQVTEAKSGKVISRPKTPASCDVEEITVVKRMTTVWHRRRRTPM